MAKPAPVEQLRLAATRGSSKEVIRLLDDGTPVEQDENGRTALHLAASAGHTDVVAALILSRCDVNVSDFAGCTALQRAAAEGHLEVVKQLIKHGADVNRQDDVHGNTALHEASWKGYSRTVATLGRVRANLHLKNRGGFAALHLCCQNGHNQSCRELLLAGCNPDLQNNYGDTPLHTSARYGHAGVTRILISAECRVSDQNKNGDTALHIAAAMGRRKLTRILLEAGCDKALRNKQNETANDIATRKDLKEILAILNNPKLAQKAGKPQREQEKERNDKKREKTESGTSSKDSSSRHKDKKKHKNAHKVHFEKTTGKQWSPYGCHYYPDPKSFPSPNLDSLPQEPLKKGEQYYLDLAGNICKGPIGVGYTCYCAPFFRHMEARLDRDKQELKDHIDQAHEKLDQKVASLERRTQGQLQEISQSVAQERTLCEERHIHLAGWLHGELSRGGMRSSERVRTEQPQTIPVPRARSLELLLDNRTSPAWHEQAYRGSVDELDGRAWYSSRDVALPAEGQSQHVHAVSGRPVWGEKDHQCADEASGLAWQGYNSKLHSHGAANWQNPHSHGSTEFLEQSKWLGNGYKEEDNVSSASSDAEDDPGVKYTEVEEVHLNPQRNPVQTNLYRAIPQHPPQAPDYENIMPYNSARWKAEENGRSRTAVYSSADYPNLEPDLHNDSGYSTKIYGSSKGPSPSLSGHLDCEGPQQVIYTAKLSSLCERPHPPCTADWEKTKKKGNIGTASLV